MKLSSLNKGGGLFSGTAISANKTLAEVDLNKMFYVTAAAVITLPKPQNIGASLGECVFLHSMTASAVSLAVGAGVTIDNFTGTVPLLQGIPVMLIATSGTSWSIIGVVSATQADIVAGTDFKKFVNSKELKAYVAAMSYTHPASHPASIITQDASNRFVTDAEKVGWNAAKNHADSAHAPSTAQKNSDITKAEIEAKLTGTLTSHLHAKLATARTISLTGDVSGSTSFDGSGNVSIEAAVANDSHTHSTYAATSHTHSTYLDKDLGFNTVGSLCIATKQTINDLAANGSIAGADLKVKTSFYSGSVPALSGTWRALTPVGGKTVTGQDPTTYGYGEGLFQRIS